MKKSMFTVLVMVLLTGFAIESTAQNVKKIKKEIEKINTIIEKGMVSGESGVMDDYYAEDYIGMPNMSPMIKGKEAAKAADEEFHKSGIKVLLFKLNTMDVIISGGYAIEYGHWDMSMEIPGMPEPWKDNGKYVTLWKIEKGNKVKMKLDIWNSDTNPWEAMQGMKEPSHKHDKDVDHR